MQEKLNKEDFVNIGLSPDYIRAWGSRMCFRKGQYDVVYHVDTNTVIVKELKLKRRMYPSKVVYTGVGSEIELEEIKRIING